MELTYLGHSSFLIKTAGKQLLFDPFISPNELAKGKVNLDDLKPDYILLTHGHGDHVADAEALARANNAPIISNYEIVSWYESKGLNGHPLNHGGKWTFDFGTVCYVNAVHSSVLPDGTYGGNPGGFVITTADGTFYVAGDTALTMDMKLIPLLYPKLDFAILPIGDNFTMDAAAAVIASDFIACDRIVGCHYDTFGYIKINHEATSALFAERGKTLILPNIGEPFEL